MTTEELHVFDAADFTRRCMGSHALAARILRAYVKEFPQQLETLQRLGAEGDLEALRRLAHQMKGAASNLSALQLREQLERLERSSEQGRAEDAAAAAQSLTEFWRQFLEFAAPVLHSTALCEV